MLCGSFALAGAGSVTSGVNVQGAFFTQYFTQDPTVTWTFSTSGLSAGADTVIHVQDAVDPQAGFVAGNDDVGASLASSVTVPPNGTTRTLLVIVRAYSELTQGTGTFSGVSS